jgi:hypothetical protein
LKSIVWLLILFLFSCTSDKSADLSVRHELRVERLKGSDYWKYVVRKGDKIVIEQTFVPAFSGKQPFYDSVAASSIGLVVLNKLDSGIFPPSVSKSEVIDAWPMNALLPED